jgi:hypothetical protein
MSQDTALLLALALAGAAGLGRSAGLPAEAQLVIACAAFVCMAGAIRLLTPLALVGAALAALALDLFIEPSEDAAEWIVPALLFACGLPAAIYDLRALRRRPSQTAAA